MSNSVPSQTRSTPLINADKPLRWKADIAASVDMYNEWFLRFAPDAYKAERARATEHVRDVMLHTADFKNLAPDDLRAHPRILRTLRMCTAPPIARDRLIGLAYTSPNLVGKMEEDDLLPPRMQRVELDKHLLRICKVIEDLLDRDLFPWLSAPQSQQSEPHEFAAGSPPDQERTRAASVVADRLCGAATDPIVRNAQERRQLALLEAFLVARGYRKLPHHANRPLTEMEAGTYSFRMNVVVTNTGGEDVKQKQTNIPIDAVIQPHRLRPHRLPILIEAKSAGDFTNTNKRQKEEAQKLHQLRNTFGPDIHLVLFLCGYFGASYLGYEASEGLDWVWEHRIEDMAEMDLGR